MKKKMITLCMVFVMLISMFPLQSQKVVYAGNMEISNSGIELIKNFEKCELTAYKAIITLADLVRGDVNGDGKVNTKDITLIMQYYAGWDVDINLNEADVNGDGKVNTKDATLIMQYYAGWNVEFK